jgi:hypothetical protein
LRMDTGAAKDLFSRYAAAVAYVEVLTKQDNLARGSAFHVGNSVFVTARHVVDVRKIIRIGLTENQVIPLPHERDAAAPPWGGRYTNWTLRDGQQIQYSVLDNMAKGRNSIRLSEGPFHPEREDVDVAVFTVKGLDSGTPFVPLGRHLNMELRDTDFVLDECIVMGYPPIPMTSRPHLVAAQAQINAQVARRDVPHPHFILSTTARGGFSGGVVIHEKGMGLGVVTSSLLERPGSPESGFMAVLSVEPIYRCLIQHDRLPSVQGVPPDVVDMLKLFMSRGHNSEYYKQLD